MDYTDFTSEQIKFLKYLKSQSSVTLDDIEAKYPRDVISRTFDILLRNSYIDRDGMPIFVTALVTSVVTYLVMPYILGLFS